MLVVVIGGTGLIGSKVVAQLSAHGHQVVAASPASGVNTVIGEAAEDVATAVARAATGQAQGGLREIAGPERHSLDDLVRARLGAIQDGRRVITDPQAPYFGVVLDDHTLVPGDTATVFPTRFADWLVDNAAVPAR